MCMTLRHARLTNTVIYAAEVQRDSEVFHVIGYQNKAKAIGPNAMILPIPSAEPLGPANVIDTRKFKDILNSYSRAVRRHKPPQDVRRGTRSMLYASKGAMRGFQVFESGSYTIALAENPHSMRLALDHVPEEKRPEIPGTFLAGLTQLYKDWPMAICCFKGNLEAPEPLLWWFKPRFNRVLFAPAIDAHDGSPPDPQTMVDRDHTLAFATFRSNRPHDPALLGTIQDLPAEHQWMFLPSVVGKEILHRTGNGDFSLPISAILDERVPSWLENIDITPPPKELPTRYDHIMAGGALA